MTQISISEWGNGAFVRMNGHADTQPYGKDLVCAALSAYVYFLAEILEVLEKENKVWCPIKVIEPGNVHLLVLPNKEGKDTVDTVLNAVKRGLKKLSRDYPTAIMFDE